jgi:hypothetical protein
MKAFVNQVTRICIMVNIMMGIFDWCIAPCHRVIDIPSVFDMAVVIADTDRVE